MLAFLGVLLVLLACAWDIWRECRSRQRTLDDPLPIGWGAVHKEKR